MRKFPEYKEKICIACERRFIPLSSTHKYCCLTKEEIKSKYYLKNIEKYHKRKKEYYQKNKEILLKYREYYYKTKVKPNKSPIIKKK